MTFGRLALAAVLGGTTLAASGPGEPIEADLGAVERVLDESRAVRAIDEPGFADWLAHVTTRLGGAAGSRIAGGIDRVSLPTWLLRTAATALAGILVLIMTAAFLGGPALRRRRASSREEPEPRADRTPAVVGQGPESWRREIDRRLDVGDVPGVLEACWWWTASRIGVDADPAWTSREMIGRAGRPDLAPEMRRLDALAFGASPPTDGALRSFVARLEARLT